MKSRTKRKIYKRIIKKIKSGKGLTEFEKRHYMEIRKPSILNSERIMREIGMDIKLTEMRKEISLDPDRITTGILNEVEVAGVEIYADDQIDSSSMEIDCSDCVDSKKSFSFSEEKTADAIISISKAGLIKAEGAVSFLDERLNKQKEINKWGKIKSRLKGWFGK